MDKQTDVLLPEGLRPDDGRLAPEEDLNGGQRGPAIRTEGQRGRDNRGMRAPQTGSGVVIGSGASAGGGGGSEDHDSDPSCGGGAIRMNRAKE